MEPRSQLSEVQVADAYATLDLFVRPGLSASSQDAAKATRLTPSSPQPPCKLAQHGQAPHAQVASDHGLAVASCDSGGAAVAGGPSMLENWEDGELPEAAHPSAGQCSDSVLYRIASSRHSQSACNELKWLTDLFFVTAAIALLRKTVAIKLLKATVHNKILEGLAGLQICH